MPGHAKKLNRPAYHLDKLIITHELNKMENLRKINTSQSENTKYIAVTKLIMKREKSHNRLALLD